MCTLAINREKNGIELSFLEKPSEAIRESMKNLGFRWHRVKKFWYAKQTEERMKLAKQLSETPEASGMESKTETVSENEAPVFTKKEPISKYGIQVGDILFDSWGYNMTIVEYYKVTRIISPSKVEIVELGHKVIETDRGGGETVIPDPEREIGERIEKLVVKSSREGGFHIKIDSSVQLIKWDGKPKYSNHFD